MQSVRQIGAAAVPQMRMAAAVRVSVSRGVRAMSNSPIKETSVWSTPLKAIRQGIAKYGGMDVWKQIRQTKDMKIGTIVGEDELGNRYFENKDEQFGRDRWVVFNTKEQHMDYDPGSVPAEWHGWLHHISDHVPQSGDTKPKCGYTQQYDSLWKTGRDARYLNPGHFMGGKARGDGYGLKTGTARPSFTKWDPESSDEVNK